MLLGTRGRHLCGVFSGPPSCPACSARLSGSFAGWAPWGADSEWDAWGQQVWQLGISPEEGVGAGKDGALKSPEADSPGLRAVGPGRSRQSLSGHWMPTALGRMCPWLRPSLPLSEGTSHRGLRARAVCGKQPLIPKGGSGRPPPSSLKLPDPHWSGLVAFAVLSKSVC